MDSVAGKRVVVMGLGVSGLAACRLLLAEGANVTAVDAGNSEALRVRGRSLEAEGATVHLGLNGKLAGEYDLVVISPGVPTSNPTAQTLHAAGIPIIGELELGWRHSLCLSIGITGTNGKTTTTELMAALLNYAQRPTVAAGNIGTPVCEVASLTRDLDVLTLEVSSFQLEAVDQFRPTVGILTNLTPDHLDRYEDMEDYIRAKARLFENQQPFDWAIVQHEALEQLRELGLEPVAKRVTFSARCSDADLYLDRSLIVSRLPEWTGPLLDLEECQLTGPHNAENLMAVLAAGRVMGLALEDMREALAAYEPLPHRCEFVAEVDGIKFYNDSKGTNVDALRRALEAMPAGPEGDKNVWLIAGGQDKEMHFHDAGPELSRRVKEAFLIGEARDKIRAAWSLFTACQSVETLAGCLRLTRRKANPGDVVLLSPACASFDMFENYQARGNAFRQLVLQAAKESVG
ncbi:MAG: UDP-N-acetylmuramoyl-L-alanine--D-glutamate ligase [Verrucomicrobiales bacterium]|nr:UDP-N-acetylmuramoyl-L-alanine--D-glutamate ligase [Verrucomicrobiales bacterium]